MSGARTERDGRVLRVTLDRPARKNALTFESYAMLRDLFTALRDDGSVRSVIVTGTDGNFCSGGDVHEIIGPLTQRTPAGLLEFTQMTGDVVKAMRECPQPIVAAIDGICAGAGAILAMASDLRLGTARSSVAFLFVRVGLAGCDMGACAMLPRIVGLGRASELLYTGRAMPGTQAMDWGFFNEICDPDFLQSRATELARTLAEGPARAHAMTKRMLLAEWSMPLPEAIDAEAVAQAECMTHNDFKRAYAAYVAREPVRFEGD
jgi:enoyl-CoA hydratase/carnithine racemase